MIPAALVPCPRCGGDHRLAGEPLPGQLDWNAPIRYAADEICALCDPSGKVPFGTRCECYLPGGGEERNCDWCGKNYRPQLSGAPCQHEIPDNHRQYDARWSFCSEDCAHVELHDQLAGACARCDSLTAEMEKKRLAGLISRRSPGATPGSATNSSSAADDGGSAARLGVAPRTVQCHVDHICEKLGITAHYRRAELIARYGAPADRMADLEQRVAALEARCGE